MTNITQFGKRAADRLATATNNGLLAVADYVKLQALRFGGTASTRILLPPDYTSFVAEESGGGDAHLQSPNHWAFVEAKQNVYLAANLAYDGTNWNRLDVAASSSLLTLTSAWTFVLQTAAAGANPVAAFTTVGNFTLNALGLQMDPPRVQARGGSNSPASGVETNAPSFTTVDLNTGGVLGGTPFTNGGGFTVPVAGAYEFNFSGFFNASGAGTRRYIGFKHSGIGTYIAQAMPPNAAASYSQTISSILGCSAGVVITPVVFQDTGINFPFTNNIFAVRYLGVS